MAGTGKLPRGLRRGKSGNLYIDIQLRGHRIQASCHTTDVKLATRLLKEQQDRLYRLTVLGEQAHTWDEACEAWVTMKRLAGKRTLAKDEQIIEWFRPHFEGKELAALTKDVIESTVIDGLKGRKPATLNQYLQLARGVLGLARDKGWIAVVPKLVRFELPAEAPGTGAWSPEKAAELLSALPPHQRRLLAFALSTGLRQANVRLLTWDRVDLERRVCWIEAASAKGKRAIPVPLNDDALAILKECEGDDAQYVFVYVRRNKAGEIINRSAPIANVNTKAFRRRAVQLGLSTRWHNSRHTWATMHKRAGTDDRVLMRLGGWSSLQMVGRYSHLDPGFLAEHAGNVKLPISVKKLLTGASTDSENPDNSLNPDGPCWTRTNDQRIMRSEGEE